MGALLALMSLAPAGLLRSAPVPCAGPAAARSACACERCADDAPAAPTLDALPCGCCAKVPAPAPTRPSSPIFTLLTAPAMAEFVAPVAGRPRHLSDARRSASESAPSARLLHCVQLI